MSNRAATVPQVVVGEPYAWTVTATVPDDPTKMPRHRWRQTYAWAAASSAWFKPHNMSERDGWGLKAGAKAAKTWTKESVARQQATVARNCGFIVDITALYPESNDPLVAKYEKALDRIGMLEAEIDLLRQEQAKDRIYITQLEASIRDRVAIENHHI